MPPRRELATAAVVVVVSQLPACAAIEPATREQRVIDALADDNYVWALREPELVALKLRKMQRGPYEWLRGTAALYWQDLTEPGPRAATAFGDPASSRVLLLGDPHVENAGTFRAADGAMLVDWNDFDATGYGPFTADLRRLAASVIVVARLGAPDDAALADELARRVASGYAGEIERLASGAEAGAMGFGASPLFDDELAKAATRGDTRDALAEVAPIVEDHRELALGDLEPVAEDGVIEDRIERVSPAQAVWIDAAVATWRRGLLDPTAATIKLRARRLGAGVSSYALYRFVAVLEGATAALDDDLVIELKETREGIVVHGVPQLAVGAWSSPAERAVQTQRRLQARTDADPLLGAADLGGLTLKVRDREAYQRGIDADDLVELAAGDAEDRDELRELARLYGSMLARAHGCAATSDGLVGWSVIAPVIAGRAEALADEIAWLALADAEQLIADHAAMKDRDLAGEIGIDAERRHR
jgi:hypothetical protein